MCKLTDQSKIHPLVRTVNKGDDTTFLCDSSRQVEWQFNGKPTLPTNVREIAATLLYIDRVDLLNQGIYQCKGENNFSETFYARGELQILGMIVQTNCDNDI